MLERKKPAYTIFSDATLEDLIRKHPTNSNELLEIFGIGPKRVKEFGEELLEIVRSCK
jgi:DNA helicase-2/ATP-dependent DNA helicase PcrA